MLREERLQLTQHGNNHNKFYNMLQLSAEALAALPTKLLKGVDMAGEYFLATWGRVGNKGQSRPFPMSQFEHKLRAKTAKGYVRLTQLLVTEDTKPAPEKISSVQTLLDHLQQASHNQVQVNYTLSKFGDVTEAQLDKVQRLLDKFGDMISDRVTMFALTQQLAMIWTILPRKIEGDLRKLKIADYEEARAGLQKEQDVIDALSAQRVVATSGGKPISEAMGMTITPRDDMMPGIFPDFPFVRDHDGLKQGRVDAMWAVSHAPTAAAYNAVKQADKRFQEYLYFHGSANENWLSIFDGGLRIRPAGVSTNGDMFGRGVYFANLPMKSLGYCGLDGIGRWAAGNEQCVYVALFRVNVGRQFVLQSVGDENKIKARTGGQGTLSLDKLRPFGFDTVLVKAKYSTTTGMHIYNDEIVVYEPGRATISGLARIKAI